MAEYGGWTREQLVERLRELEGIIAREQLQTAEHKTARKREQTALRDREARLRAILDRAVEGIITIDERGIIESCNQAAEKIFGYKPVEMIGHNISMLMPEPYREN